MNGIHSRTSDSTSLDITPEKKDLVRAIEEGEKRYSLILKKAQLLKRDISDFQKIYDARIRRLYQRLNALESLLFKYRNISEYVDDIFSFTEAQNIFEETMKDRRARMEDEYREQNRIKDSADKIKGMPGKDREELKRIYRSLARIFHPDKTGGDEQMMKRINKAYKEGDLESLRDLDLEHVSKSDDTSFKGLQNRLEIVLRLIKKVNKEITSLRKSDMYILRKNLSKMSITETGNVLDHLARELRREIVKKEQELEVYVEKFGRGD